MYVVIYFVFRKASKKLKDKSDWLKYKLRPVFAISLLFNTIFITFLEYQMVRVLNNDLRMHVREIAL